MPLIDLDQLQHRPIEAIDSRITMTGSASKATCPGYSVTATDSASLSTGADALRYRQLLSALGVPQKTHVARLSATLRWAGEQTLSTGATVTDYWSGEVYDLLDSPAGRTVSRTIAAPRVEFDLLSEQKASCMFVYSQLDLVIDYTVTLQVMYDADGNSSWTASMPGRYMAVGHTNLLTVVRIVNSSSGALAGKCSFAAEGLHAGTAMHAGVSGEAHLQCARRRAFGTDSLLVASCSSSLGGPEQQQRARA
jgi:hypothetical protein